MARHDVTYFQLYQMRVLLRTIGDLHEYLRRRAAELHDAKELVRLASAVHAALNQRQPS